MRISLGFIARGVLIATLVGCEPVPTDLALSPSRGKVPPSRSLGARSEKNIAMFPRRGPSRTDTPWRRLSRDQLAGQIAQTAGDVLIGFKEPDSTAGVDDYGRVLVGTRSIAAAKGALRALGIEIRREYSNVPAVAARMLPSQLADVQALRVVEYVEPDSRGDTYDSDQTTWNVTRVEAPAAWSGHNDGDGQKLFILDSGIQSSHPDLDVAGAYSCVDSLPDIDSKGHGTAVAGIAAALANDTMIVGVAPGVALWSVKVSSPAVESSTDNYVCGFDYARDQEADVINLSVRPASSSTTLTDMINGAFYVDDIVIVSAAGNNVGPNVPYPYSLSSVMPVGALDSTNTRLPSSASAGVTIWAPGAKSYNAVGLTTTCADGSIGTACYFVGEGGAQVQGTSFAAPHVAAAAAILRADEPDYSAGEIRWLIWAGSLFENYLLLDIDMSAALPLPYPNFFAEIIGPSEIQVSHGCQWYASSSGGEEPLTYYWYVNGQPAGDGTSVLSFQNSGPLNGTFTIVVAIYAGDGNLGYDEHEVLMDGASYCY